MMQDQPLKGPRQQRFRVRLTVRGAIAVVLTLGIGWWLIVIAFGFKSAFDHYNRGCAWHEKKEYDKAIADYNEAIRLDPKYRPCLQQPRLRLDEKKEYDKAIADFTEAIRLDPKYATPSTTAACAWSDKKEYDKAIADLHEAIRLDPKDADAYLQSRHGLERQEGVRQGHRRLRRGHPARSQERHALRLVAATPGP